MTDGSAMKVQALLLFAMWAFSGALMAQTQAPHVCGSGPGPNEVMAGMHPGANGVAPTPLCYWTSLPEQQQSVQPPRPTGYWEKTWGAIAPSPAGGILGTALGAHSKEEAERLALEDCKAKGGGECQVDLVYHNQCAAMVVGDKRLRLQGAESIEAASRLAMSRCEESDTNCKVYYSACTEPIFHKY